MIWKIVPSLCLHGRRPVARVSHCSPHICFGISSPEPVFPPCRPSARCVDYKAASCAPGAEANALNTINRGFQVNPAVGLAIAAERPEEGGGHPCCWGTSGSAAAAGGVLPCCWAQPEAPGAQAVGHGVPGTRGVYKIATALSGCCVNSGSKLTVLMSGLSRHLKGKEVKPVLLVVLFKADCGLSFKI